MLTIWPEIAKIVPVLLQTLGFFCTFLIFCVIDSFGRKTIVQNALLVKTALSLLLFICFLLRDEATPKASPLNYLIVSCMVGIRGVFSLSLGPITWLYLP